MNFIPLTVVDNFFDDPDLIREFALQQEFFPSPGNYPGQRTNTLDKINPELLNTLTKKVFSLFYNFNHESITWATSAYFHKIPAFYESGWIHTDDTSNLSGLVYLSPTPKDAFTCGTSVYARKKEYAFNRVDTGGIMNKYYKDHAVPKEEFEEARQANNAQYEETIRIGYKYNRLVTYDAMLPHRPNNFFDDGTKNSERLTLVYFVEQLYANKYPITRMRTTHNETN